MKLNFLGFSSATASLLINSLLKEHEQLEIRIIENINSEGETTFLHGPCTVERIAIKAFKERPESPFLLCMVGPDAKRETWAECSKLLRLQKTDLISIVDIDAVVAGSVKIGSGCFVEPGVVLSPFVQLGDLVTINRSCSVGHHTELEDLVTVHPGSHIAGHCRIGEGTRIGIGTVVEDHVTIGKNCVIGSGSVVTRDVPDHSIARGSPCKVIRGKTGRQGAH